MSIFQEIIDKNNVITITHNEIYKEGWFIGSALMGQDFKNLSQNKYVYKQDTVWTKVIDLKKISPYWEIHIKTVKFLFVDQHLDTSLNLLNDILKVLKEESGNSKLQFIYITEDEDIKKWLDNNRQSYAEKKIPLSIENNRVGSYFKVFVYDDVNKKFYPFVDCTRFHLYGKEYFDININQFYMEMVKYLISKTYIPFKFKIYFEIFKIQKKVDEVLETQDETKFISLLDCLLYMSDRECPITSDYSGHITKKILKKFIFYALINGKNPEMVFDKLNPEYVIFLKKELGNYKKKFLNLIDKYDLETLEDRYGISRDIYEYLTGKYKPVKYDERERIRYFTDIPFIQENVEYLDFEQLVRKIGK